MQEGGESSGYVRTTVQVGAFRLVREREWRGAPTPVSEARPLRLGAMIGSAIVGVALAGTFAAAAPMIGIAAPYRLTVAVPTTPVPAAPAPKARHRAPVPRRAETVGVARLAVPAPDTPSEGTADTRTAAIRRALLTGDMQEWQNGPEHGFVVAGPIDQNPSGDCRALAVLTRVAGSDDRVEQKRECL